MADTVLFSVRTLPVSVSMLPDAALDIRSVRCPCRRRKQHSPSRHIIEASASVGMCYCMLCARLVTRCASRLLSLSLFMHTTLLGPASSRAPQTYLALGTRISQTIIGILIIEASACLGLGWSTSSAGDFMTLIAPSCQTMATN